MLYTRPIRPGGKTRTSVAPKRGRVPCERLLLWRASGHSGYERRKLGENGEAAQADISGQMNFGLEGQKSRLQNSGGSCK